MRLHINIAMLVERPKRRLPVVIRTIPKYHGSRRLWARSTYHAQRADETSVNPGESQCTIEEDLRAPKKSAIENEAIRRDVVSWTIIGELTC